MHQTLRNHLNWAVDASDVGAGAVLLQEDDLGIEHPICYSRRNLKRVRKIIAQAKKSY